MTYKLKEDDVAFWLKDTSEEYSMTPLITQRKEKAISGSIVVKINMCEEIFELQIRVNLLESNVSYLNDELTEIHESQLDCISRL